MKRFLLLIPLMLCCSMLQAAEYRTLNFTVYCSDSDLAKKVGDAAEFYRAKHSKEWLGAVIPKWSAPCPIHVRQGDNGNGGTTTFHFDRGHVFGWNMHIQGTPERLIDSVVPHEVLHTVFASHFRRSLPRWADEGACTYVEVEAEKKRQRLLAAEVVGTEKQFPIRKLLDLQEYPADMNAVLVMYAQGFYISEFLIDQKGKREFVRFLETYFKDGDWDAAFKTHYGYPDQEAAYTAAWQANKGESTPFNYDNYHVDVFVQDGCQPCNDWKAKELPELVKLGNFKIRMINLSESHNKQRGSWDDIKGTPAFIIYENEKRVKIVNGYRSWENLLKDCRLTKMAAATVSTDELTKSKPKTVQVAQGIGIGYFGEVGGNKPRANPHSDFSAAQLQIINQAIDSRSMLKIDNAIATKQDQLKAVIKAEIQQTILDIQSRLTDEQKALINATDDQKATIAGLHSKIEAVEAGTSKFIEDNQKAQAEAEEQNKALAEEVEAATTETTSLKQQLAGLAKEGISKGADAAMGALGFSGPPSAVLAIIGGAATYLWNRRKKDELEKKPAKTD